MWGGRVSVMHETGVEKRPGMRMTPDLLKRTSAHILKALAWNRIFFDGTPLVTVVTEAGTGTRSHEELCRQLISELEVDDDIFGESVVNRRSDLCYALMVNVEAYKIVQKV